MLNVIRRTGAAATIVIAALALVLSGTVDAQESVDDPAHIDDGKVIYESSCVGCHADTGVGTQNGPPLTDAASRQDRADHIALVTAGGGGMPGFGERYTPEEIGTVVSYVRLTFSESEAAQDTEQLETLPTTGFEENMAIAGLFLIAGGGALVLIADRVRRAPVRLKARYKK